MTLLMSIPLGYINIIHKMLYIIFIYLYIQLYYINCNIIIIYADT